MQQLTLGFMTVAINTKALRQARHMTQEHLAEAANINVRTIQRLEAGGPYSMETIRAIASVLEVDTETLEVDIDAIARRAALIAENFLKVRLQRANRPSTIGRHLPLCGIHFDPIEFDSDVEDDAWDEFASALSDVIDLWPMVSTADRPLLKETLRTPLEALSHLGIHVFVGTYSVRPKAAQPDRKAAVLDVLLVRATRDDEASLDVLVDRRKAVNFT